MARRKYSGPLAMDLFRPLERDGAALLSDQLVARIGEMIATGRLKAGEYLPPIRLLAGKLRVNVGTVAKAYGSLRRQGLAAPDSTRGLRVSLRTASVFRTAGQPWAGPVMRPVVPVDPLGINLPRSVGSRLVRFHVSEPSANLMPAELVARAFAVTLQDEEGLRYAPLEGLPEAHAAVERYLGQRGIAVAGAEVFLTTGTTQSLAIVTRALVPPGGVVLTEHPTWHVALAIFAAAGVRVIALPVDDEGMQIEALGDAVLRHNPAFLYLQPEFQNPTGVSLSPDRRTELIAMARKFQLPIVEDDFAAELAFRTTLPPLRIADGADFVIYLKSFAKLLAPALRVGVIVAPTRYAAAFRSIKHGLDPFVSAIAQRALAECLKAPEFEEHIRSLGAALNQRFQTLEQALRRRMPPGVRWTTPSGGFTAWLELPSRARPDDFIHAAAKRGVHLAPGRLFCVDDSGNRGLRLAFAATTPAEIERGVDIMADLLEARARSRRPQDRLPHTAVP
jgi:GntR family transcriptional regulator